MTDEERATHLLEPFKVDVLKLKLAMRDDRDHQRPADGRTDAPPDTEGNPRHSGPTSAPSLDPTLIQAACDE